MRHASMLIIALFGFSVAGAGDKQSPPLSPNDFLTDAAACNHALIEYGKLAEGRASAGKVRDFANELAKDHRASYDELAGLLKKRKLAIVAGTEKETREELKRLRGLEGSAFDDAFLKRVIQDHDRAIAQCDAQAKAGQDADVRAYASNQLPGLRKHRAHAQELVKLLSK